MLEAFRQSHLTDLGAAERRRAILQLLLRPPKLGLEVPQLGVEVGVLRLQEEQRGRARPLRHGTSIGERSLYRQRMVVGSLSAVVPVHLLLLSCWLRLGLMLRNKAGEAGAAGHLS